MVINYIWNDIYRARKFVYFNYELMTTMTEDYRLRQFFCYVLNTNILFADFFPNIWAQLHNINSNN